MKWLLIVTISYTIGGYGGGGVTTNRIASFDTKEECIEAGREYVKGSNSRYNVDFQCIRGHVSKR